MNAEQYVADWPDKLVEILESDIQLAHNINPKSWSIFSYKDAPVFGVSRTTNLYLSPDTNRAFLQIKLIETNEETKRWLRHNGNTFEDDQQDLDVRIPLSALNEIPDNLLAAHHDHIRSLAHHRNNRWKSFREDFHQAFSKRLREPLPLPGYYAQLIESRNEEAKQEAPQQSYDSTKVEPTGYWLITSNPNNATEAHDYVRSLEEGRIIHRYGDLSADFSEYPSDRTQFVRQAVNLDGIAQRTGNRLWLFTYGVQEGDWIVLQSTHPAIGQFTSEYQHTEDGDIRTVDWHWVSPNPIDTKIFYSALNGRNLWGFTTLEPIEFKRILEALGQEPLVNMGHVTERPSPTYARRESDFYGSVHDISAHFAASGLNYTDTQIADFYTALQTKGFVVLSGISGTGKSKIATGFTKLLPNSAVADEMPQGFDVDAILVRLKPYSKKYTRIIIPVRFEHLFPPLASGESVRVPIEVSGQRYYGRLQRDRVLALYWRKELSEIVNSYNDETPIVFSPQWISNDDEQLDYVSMHFIEEGRQKVAKSVAVSNTLFLSVRPDWRDSTSLLGYYNPLTQTYEWTDFLRFILNAADNYRCDAPIAWFVILDEMNLAHVEYYFADLLSVLESGRVTEPKSTEYGFSQEPLRLTYPEDIVNEAPPSAIHMPPNLYIIGTVNMDETTHAFSPKVLDRAFTMELTEVDFTDYPRETNMENTPKLSEIDKQHFLDVFSQNRAFPQISKTEIGSYVATNNDIRVSLQRLNTALAVHRFHFGYRVFDEIVQFLANAEANQMYPSRVAALDSAAFMKILPKFSGSEARVGQPLLSLIDWASDPFGTGEDAAPLQRTLHRARFMQDILRTDGFVTAF